MSPIIPHVTVDHRCANCLRPLTEGARDGSHLCPACWSEVKTAVLFRVHPRG